MPRSTNHSGRLTRVSSACGSRSVVTSTARSLAISAWVRCRMKSGFDRHLTVRFFPSGMSLSLTSILAKASTSADGATLATMSWTIAFAPYAVATPTANVDIYEYVCLSSAASFAEPCGSDERSFRYSLKSGIFTSVCANRICALSFLNES